MGRSCCLELRFVLESLLSLNHDKRRINKSQEVGSTPNLYRKPTVRSRLTMSRDIIFDVQQPTKKLKTNITCLLFVSFVFVHSKET